MKKSLFIISTICAITLIIVFCIFVSQNNTKSDLVNSQKNKVVSFYKSNINNLNKIKDYLWDKNYTIIHIESNGNALLTDGTSVYLSDIIKNITQLYNDSKELNIDTISFGPLEPHGENELRIENFFQENNVKIDIVYSEANFSEDNMYTLLEDNWYIFVAPMT